MYRFLIVAGFVGTVGMAPAVPPTQHDAVSGSDARAGWIVLYVDPFYMTGSGDVLPPGTCKPLPGMVGSAKNHSDQTVAFYPHPGCGGIPTVVEPGQDVPYFVQQPVDFGPYPDHIADPGQVAGAATARE